MKKLLLVTCCLLFVICYSGCLPKKTGETPTPAAPTAEGSAGETFGLSPAAVAPTVSSLLPLEGRPYVTLVSRVDGKELTLSISGIVGAKTLEYELTYLAGEPGNQLQRGVVGSVELEGRTDYTKAILLGSCSKNVCKYDEGVSEGTITLTLRAPEGTAQKYESAFHLQPGKAGKEGLTSGDGNFRLTSSSLPPAAFYLTLSTVGLFQTPVGKIVGGPYGIFTPASSKIAGKVSLRLTKTAANPQILVWDKKSWQELTTGFETNGDLVSATTDRLGTFVVVEE